MNLKLLLLLNSSILRLLLHSLTFHSGGVIKHTLPATAQRSFIDHGRSFSLSCKPFRFRHSTVIPPVGHIPVKSLLIDIWRRRLSALVEWQPRRSISSMNVRSRGHWMTLCNPIDRSLVEICPKLQLIWDKLSSSYFIASLQPKWLWFIRNIACSDKTVH